eukprot:215911_1
MASVRIVPQGLIYSDVAKSNSFRKVVELVTRRFYEIEKIKPAAIMYWIVYEKDRHVKGDGIWDDDIPLKKLTEWINNDLKACGKKKKAQSGRKRKMESTDIGQNDGEAAPPHKKRKPNSTTTTNDDDEKEMMRFMELERNCTEFWNNLSWDFDVQAFNEKSCQNPIVVLGWHFLQEFSQEFNLSSSATMSFLFRIQKSYHKQNQYHNALHAADVMYNIHWLLTRFQFSSFERFICVFAAACHDCDHDGHNNKYHEKQMGDGSAAADESETTPKTPSIQENHHIEYAKQVAKECGFKLSEKGWKYFTRLILDTDMIHHGKHMKSMTSLTKKLNSNVEMNDDDRLDLVSVIFHCADIGNAAKCSNLCVEWAKRCIGEFRTQGEDEMRVFGEISDQLNDKKYPLEASQMGWIEFVILPYLVQLNTLFEAMNADLKQLITNAEKNLEQWKEYKEVIDIE